MTDGWKYYNHAAIPVTAPHEEVNLLPIKDGSIWKLRGRPLLARWTTDWDCGHKTNWWYIIKDEPLDIASLKSKRRYEILKGKRNFEVKKINPFVYAEDLFTVTIEAYRGWPEKYRPEVNLKEFKNDILNWSGQDVFGAFDRKDGALSGYARLTDYESYAEFSVLRTIPETERLAVNAAMVAGILEYYGDRLKNGFYINDGSRSVRHETAFQDYLEKYFGFRKVYCRLRIKYRKGVGLLVKCLYPFREHVTDKTKIGSQISGILKMEEIRRN